MQELLSAHHGDILPGIYDLSTDMTAQQMLEIMSTPTEKETGSNADSSKEQESGIEENTGEDSTDEGAENPDGEAAE